MRSITILAGIVLAEIHRPVPSEGRPDTMEAAGKVTVTLARLMEPVRIVITKLR